MSAKEVLKGRLETTYFKAYKFQQSNSNELNRAQKIHKEAVDLFEAYHFNEAIIAFEQAINIRSQFLRLGGESTPKIHERIVAGYINIGNCELELFNFDAAEEYFKIALSYIENNGGELGDYYPNMLATVNHALGRNSLKKGEFSMAQQYLDLAESLGLKSSIEPYVQANIYIDKSLVYDYIQEPEKVISNSSKAVKIFKELINPNDWDRIDWANALLHLSEGYILSNQFPDAINNLNEGIELLKSLRDQNALSSPYLPFLKNNIYNNLSWAYRELEVFDEAKNAINTSIDLLDIDDPLLSRNYINNGDIFFDLKEYPKAIESYDNSIRLLENTVRKKERKFSINSNTLSSHNKLDYIEAHYAKGLAYARMGTKESIQYFQEAENLIDQFRINIKEEGTKIQLSKIAKRIYNEALTTSIQLGAREEAFSFSEKAKEYALLDGVKHNKAMKFGKISRVYLEQERNLNEKIIELEVKLQNNYDDDLLAEQILLKDSLSKVIGQIEEQHPSYYKMKYGGDELGVNQIQKELIEDNQSLIQYYIGENQSYAFVISKNNEILVQEIGMPKSKLESLCLTYLNSINTPNYRKANHPNNYREAAHTLYKALIQPIEGFIGDNQRLIIVPDGILGKIPFEAFLTERVPTDQLENFRSYPYLKNNYTISYSYSAALLKEMKDLEIDKSKKGILDFAPLEIGALKDLSAGLQNIFGKTEDLRVERVDNEAATKEYLEQFGKDYKIINFATQGVVNWQEPNFSYLVFSTKDRKKERFYLLNLYGIDLNAQMIVIAACDASSGKYFEGSGYANFVRGFSYSGTKSLVSTLWQVRGRATTDILNEFYQNCKNGLSIDKALNTGKEVYIDKSSEGNAHPYFWAGVIPIGDMSALNEKNGGFGLKQILIGILVLVVLLLIYRNRNKNQQ